MHSGGTSRHVHEVVNVGSQYQETDKFPQLNHCKQNKQLGQLICRFFQTFQNLDTTRNMDYHYLSARLSIFR